MGSHSHRIHWHSVFVLERGQGGQCSPSLSGFHFFTLRDRGAHAKKTTPNDETWLSTQGQFNPQANPRMRLALLTARRTAPHCLSEPSLRERMMRSFRRNLPPCVDGDFSRYGRPPHSAIASRSRVLSCWHCTYRAWIARQRSGHFSAKVETEEQIDLTGNAAERRSRPSA